MKKYFFIMFFFLSCSNNVPDNLISKEEMENIIFDIMILNASSGFDLKIDKNLISDELIYKKYGIDSLQFIESELYYYKNPRQHFEIYKKVKEKILKSINSLNSIDSLMINNN